MGIGQWPVPIHLSVRWRLAWGADSGGLLVGAVLSAGLDLTIDNALNATAGVASSAEIHKSVVQNTVGVQITTVPEPATLSLLLLGGAAMLRRRK